ncbi:MAG: GFA family protein [Oligoflexia bacterium]|nr:GFA family protein [Oligoflexia bacterium]
MEKRKGSCHCGKVQFEASGSFEEVISCNCSICQKKGSLLAFVGEKDFHLISGADALVNYQFGKKSIDHMFCSNCGISSFSSGTAPDGQKMKAINVRCLEGTNIEDLRVKTFDGRSL